MALITATTAALVSIGIGAATAAVVAPVVVGTVASVGLSLLANALAPPEPVTAAGAAATGFEKEISYSTVPPRTWLVGRAVTAGSHVYSQVSDIKPSGDPHGGSTQNRYYDTVIALADHPCAALARLQVNEEWRSGLDETTPGKMGDPVPGFSRKGDDKLYAKIHLGAVDQAADERLVEASRARDDFSLVWNSNHRLRGVTYLRLTAKYDAKVFEDWPEAVALLDGAPIYDMRLDDTIDGGVGDHRLDDESTWEHSSNPAVILAHFLRGYRVNSRLHVGLQGTTLDMIDVESFLQAADDCDDAIDLKGGGTEPRYEIGFEFTTDLDNAAIAETLLSAMAGRLCWTGARWRLFAGVAQTPVASITDDDLLITEPREYDPRNGLADLVNRVTAEYTEPDEDYSVVAAQPRSSSADRTEDGDRQLTLDLALHGVQSNTQAQRIMEIARRQAREMKRHRIALPPKWIALEVGDWLEWTSTRWGYVLKTFRVDNVEISHDLTVFVHLAECSDHVFGWDEDVDELDKEILDLAPGGDPDDDVLLDLTLNTFVDRPYTRRARVGIGATWVEPDNGRIEMVELQWRRQGTTKVFTERVDVEELEWSTTKSIRDDTVYEVRWRPRFGRGGGYGDWSEEWEDADTIESALLFDASDAPVPALTVTPVVRPTTGKKRRAVLQVAWTEDSMRWPAGESPPAAVDNRITGVEFRFRIDGETNEDWQYEQTRGLDDRFFRVTKGVRPETLYEYQARFLFVGGEKGDWSTVAEVTTEAEFDASSAPVPDLSGTASDIDPIVIDGPDGNERAGFKLIVPDPADARITGMLVQWRKSGTSPVADPDERLFKSFTLCRVTEGIRSRGVYDFRAAFIFEGDYQGNFCDWVIGVSAVDAREDDTLITRGDRVVNSSFERRDKDGNPKNWYHFNGSGWYSEASSDAYHKSRYLRRDGTGSAVTATFQQTEESRLEAEAGQRWVATCRARRFGTVSFNPGGGVALLIKYLDKDDGNLGTDSSGIVSALNTTWDELEIQGNDCPTGTASIAVAVLASGHISGSIGVDFVKVDLQARGINIRNDAVGSNKISDGAVGPQKIANDAVETAKIKDANVTQAKFAADAVCVAGEVENESTGTITSTSFAEVLSTGSFTAYKKTKLTAKLIFRSNHASNYSECNFRLTVNQPGFTQVIVDETDIVGSKNNTAASPSEYDQKVITLTGVYTLQGSNTSASLTARVYALTTSGTANGRWNRVKIDWISGP